MFEKSYGVNGTNQYGNLGGQTVTEPQAARDFQRYVGLRLSLNC